MRNFAIVLIIAGIVMVLITGFNIITKEKVIDAGPLEINKKENHPVKWSPIAGAVILVSGVLLYVTNKKK